MKLHVNDVLLRADMVSLVERFGNSFLRRGPDECWPWIGKRNGHTTYGILGVFTKGRTQKVLAHRFAWVLNNGPIEPRSLFVCHKCDNPECVNPRHLFLGTQVDNMIDAVAKRRFPRGEQSVRAKLTEADVVAIRNDPRRDHEMAAVYGVRTTAIGKIRRGENWAHAGGPIRAIPKSHGVAHIKAKLDEDKVRFIRSSGVDALTLSLMYGVERKAIYDVLNGVTWKHVKRS